MTPHLINKLMLNEPGKRIPTFLDSNSATHPQFICLFHSIFNLMLYINNSYISGRGHQPNDFAKFCKKLHEIQKISGRRGVSP